MSKVNRKSPLLPPPTNLERARFVSNDDGSISYLSVPDHLWVHKVYAVEVGTVFFTDDDDQKRLEDHYRRFVWTPRYVGYGRGALHMVAPDHVAQRQDSSD